MRQRYAARKDANQTEIVEAPLPHDSEAQRQKRAALLAQIEACRRAVASWPEWMRQTSSAPKWMEGWDD